MTREFCVEVVVTMMRKEIGCLACIGKHDAGNNVAGVVVKMMVELCQLFRVFWTVHAEKSGR